MASLTLFLLFFFNFASHQVSAKRVMEDGYTVTTVIDGHKLKINPQAVLPLPGSSDLLVLDSSNSSVYTVSLPISEESVVKRLYGGVDNGYSDGESGKAQFNHPRSFAIDFKGNVYVADKKNYAIRKISKSGEGVSTIAGGHSDKKPGRQDGPGWNATFSNDFDVLFVPEKCALLISDHGNMLVRWIDLKVEDCSRGSRSGLGAVSIWSLGLVLSCLVGLIIGLLVRPYIPCECFSPVRFTKTWKHCLTNLGKQGLTLCFDIRSVVASYTIYELLRRLFWLSLSHLSLMFKINNVESCSNSRKDVISLEPKKDVISLLDADDLSSCDISKSQMFADQLKDLMSSDGSLGSSSTTSEIFKLGDGAQGTSDGLSDCHGRIDNMIQANMVRFAKVAKETTPLHGPLVVSSGLVQRR